VKQLSSRDIFVPVATTPTRTHRFAGDKYLDRSEWNWATRLYDMVQNSFRRSRITELRRGGLADGFSKMSPSPRRDDAARAQLNRDTKAEIEPADLPRQDH